MIYYHWANTDAITIQTVIFNHKFPSANNPRSIVILRLWNKYREYGRRVYKLMFVCVANPLRERLGQNERKRNRRIKGRQDSPCLRRDDRPSGNICDASRHPKYLIKPGGEDPHSSHVLTLWRTPARTSRWETYFSGERRLNLEWETEARQLKA